MFFNSSTSSAVLVIGAGLAGSEAALLLASHNVKVVLCESKKISPNAAQKLSSPAELVCTNSLKSTVLTSGHGMLKYEMQKLGSKILKVADQTSVPAGDALAVDRELFSARMGELIASEKNITYVDEEISDPVEAMKRFNCDFCVIASGPLTTSKLEAWIKQHISSDDFYFYDAIAPVVDADSLDFSKLYFKDRHKTSEDGKGDYLNAPMTKEEYYNFIDALVAAEKVAPRDFEELKFFESCLPIDTMATRGVDTARFSCMKPIGLELADGSEPFAVIQLRRENLLGQAFNLVGFQTRLTYKEQLRVFRMIPGFEKAEFLKYGSIHRNSFLHAQKVLNPDLSTKAFPSIFFAGQITGVEGYTESASMGLFTAIQVMNRMLKKEAQALSFPLETCIGALVNYLMSAPKAIPMNINLGLLPPVELTREERKGRDKKGVKKEKAASRAREAFDTFFEQNLKELLT